MPTKTPRYASNEVLHPLEIEVNTFDELYSQKIAQNTIYNNHRASFYHVFRFEGTDNAHYVENKKLTFSEDCLFFINYNVMHRYSEQRCKGNMALFTDTFIGGTNEKIAFISSSKLMQVNYAVIPLRNERFAATVDSYFSLMRKRCHGKKNIPAAILVVLRNWLHNLLLMMEREYLQRSASIVIPSSDDERLTQFRSLLEKHYQTEKQVSFYAEKLHLTEKKLSQMIHAKHDVSAKVYINERLLQGAIWFLKNTTLSQGEIADKLGFDFTYFVKFFRKHTGITPAKYRKTNAAASVSTSSPE